MGALFFLMIFVPLSLLAAWRVAEPGDQRFLLRAVACTWLLLAPLVALINAWMPFTGGGDDESYYNLAATPITRLSDIFDFTAFIGLMEQPGYPWLLSLLNVITGHELIVFKWLNLFFLILLALTWYRIGLRLESRHYGRALMWVILFLTPLWFYVFFLRKDLLITLVQSWALLVTVEMWYRLRIRSIFSFSIAAFMLLLLRVPLILQSSVVLLGSFTVKVWARGARRRSWLSLLAVALLIFAAAPIFTSPEIMLTLGLYSETRVIGSEVFLESGMRHGEASEVNRLLFPLLYLFSETSGLSPQAWSQLDSGWLRGVLAVPWILLVVPFFLLGLRQMVIVLPGIARAQGFVARLRQSRLVATPWSAVVLFVASSFAVSWIVGDTTRWRIPDMPMVAALAWAGWTMSSPALRRNVLVGWFLLAGTAFILFALLRA